MTAHQFDPDITIELLVEDFRRITGNCHRRREYSELEDYVLRQDITRMEPAALVMFGRSVYGYRRIIPCHIEVLDRVYERLTDLGIQGNVIYLSQF